MEMLRMNVAAMILALGLCTGVWSQSNRPPTQDETIPVNVSAELGTVAHVSISPGERVVFNFAENDYGLTRITGIPWNSPSAGESMMVFRDVWEDGYQRNAGAGHFVNGGVVLFQLEPEMFGALSWTGPAEVSTEIWLVCDLGNESLNSGHEVIDSRRTRREIDRSGYIAQIGELLREHFPEFEWHAHIPERP